MSFFSSQSPTCFALTLSRLLLPHGVIQYSCSTYVKTTSRPLLWVFIMQLAPGGYVHMGHMESNHRKIISIWLLWREGWNWAYHQVLFSSIFSTPSIIYSTLKRKWGFPLFLFRFCKSRYVSGITSVTEQIQHWKAWKCVSYLGLAISEAELQGKWMFVSCCYIRT